MSAFLPIAGGPIAGQPILSGPAAAHFVGAASITFSQTGDFSASAAIAGATSITFSQTGALLASTALSGASTLTFSQTGALGAGASFAGAATVSFSATGTFVAGTVDAHFEGAATITFAAAGNFTASIAPIVDGPVGGSWYPKPIKYVDAGWAYTGQAKQAIYKRLIEEIEDRFVDEPVPKTKQKRVKRIEQLQEAIAPLVEATPEQSFEVVNLIDSLAGYDGTEGEYLFLIALAQQQLEHIEALQAQKQRNRRIALAMLMSS